jgi:lipid-A-disaccharide synthase
MKYYLIAGEASGDMHASNLMKAIRKNDPIAEFRCLGGDLMQAEGGLLSVHYREMALMGGLEILRHFAVLKRNRNICRQDILNFNPDILILVDYSGFNLPMARFAKEHGIKVFYYISPKLWAWAVWRVRSVKEYIDKMFVILPFETDFYRSHGIDAEYYGNPVLDSVEAYRGKNIKYPLPLKDNGKPVIALLAGSRKQEIDNILPEMLQVISHFPEYNFVIAGAPSISPEYYQKYIAGSGTDIVYNLTYPLLERSVAAIVTSGTATLETALLGIPQVVVYKTGRFNFFVGSFFVKIRFFSLVNLILDKEAVRELLQKNLAADIIHELEKILFNISYRSAMEENYRQLRNILGEPGVSERVAVRMCRLLQQV